MSWNNTGTPLQQPNQPQPLPFHQQDLIQHQLRTPPLSYDSLQRQVHLHQQQHLFQQQQLQQQQIQIQQQQQQQQQLQLQLQHRQHQHHAVVN